MHQPGRQQPLDQRRQIVEGDETPSQTTEIWTFVRERSSPWGGGIWKLSAIQETA